MLTKIRIALDIPGTNESGQSFSLPLKQNRQNERSEFYKAKNILLIVISKWDFLSMYKILFRRRVIDKYLNWIFDDNHLIIIGNSGPLNEQDSQYLWFIYSLQEKARREGGDVHFILSNQEILNLQGNWRYAHPKYAVKSAKLKNQPTALYYGNNELWHWLRTKNIIEKIGPLLFAPNGISPIVNELKISLSQINDLARKSYTGIGKINFKPEENLLLGSDDNPLKYKGYFEGRATDDEVDKTLKKFGANTIITTFENVAPGSYLNGRVINIGASSAIETPGILLIKRNHFYLFDANAKRARIK